MWFQHELLSLITVWGMGCLAGDSPQLTHESGPGLQLTVTSVQGQNELQSCLNLTGKNEERRSFLSGVFSRILLAAESVFS